MGSVQVFVFADRKIEINAACDPRQQPPAANAGRIQGGHSLRHPLPFLPSDQRAADLEGLQGNQYNDQRIAEGPVRIADRAGAIVRQKSTKRPPGILKRYQAAEE